MKNGESKRLDEETAAIYEWFQEGIKAACEQNLQDWARSYVLPLPEGFSSQEDFRSDADRRFKNGFILLRGRREAFLKMVSGQAMQ